MEKYGLSTAEFIDFTYLLEHANMPVWEGLGSSQEFANEPTAFNENQIRSPIRETSGADENKPLDIEDLERETKSLLTNEDEFQCDLCIKKYKSHSALIYHLKSKHKEKPFECYICREKFITKKYLRKHFEKFHLRFKCKNCGKLFNRKCNLIEHIKRFKGNCNGFICPECLKIFGSQNALATHKSKVHKGKEFQCDNCGRSFSLKYNLSRHKKSGRCRIHLLPCPICNERLLNKKTLRYHMKKKHAGDRKDCLDEPTAKVARIVNPNANDVVLKMEEMSLGNVQIDTEMLPTEARNTSG